MIRRSTAWLLVLGAATLAGCQMVPTSPTAAGYRGNDLIDPVAQTEGDRLGDTSEAFRLAERIREQGGQATPGAPRRSVLVLSGGGAYGAYTAGVLNGWTKTGTRPTFDVVTGISTGSLIAPLAFLGPEYDGQLKEFYTTLRKRDIFELQILRGLFMDSLASNAPLARQVDGMLTPEVITAIAAAHCQGRRLYVGTTELDSRRFVVWDIGAIACRGRPEDRELIKKILLGSSAMPGFFPPSRIPVTVNGEEYVERHVDGGTSMSLFFRPPYDPAVAAGQEPAMRRLHDTDVYVIVAGKLYADPEVVPRGAIRAAVKSVSTVAYAQTRGDLQRLFFIATLTGMDYYQAAIPPEFPAPLTNTEFDPVEMTKMFNEGVRQVCAGTVWRRSPPGVGPGESPLERYGTNLTPSHRER